jgi:thiol-disulfide isomerase/thioredoxin
MIRSGALLAGLFTLHLGAVVAADDAFEPCRSLEPVEKTTCLEGAVARSPLDRRTLRAVQGLVTSDSGTAREIVGLLLRHHAESLTEKPSRKAELLDLQGQASFELGEFDDSARAFEAALELDSGVTQLTWITADGGEGWSAEIDAGVGRLERAARSLLRTQRGENAKTLMARAVSLGGNGWTEAELAALDAAGIDSIPAPATMLTAPPWFLPIPDIEIELFGEEETLSIGELRGSVILLDFWATWCSPCKDELPQLQKLHEAEHERGLAAVAVNVQEPVQLAMPYVRALGLTMPIGKYNEDLDRVFKVTRLPSLIVIDQQGRARDRWDGYEWGVDRAVAELVRDLLAGAADPPAREVARVIEGKGLLEIDWLRQLSARGGRVRGAFRALTRF